MVLPKYDSRGSEAAAANVSKHENVRFTGSGPVSTAKNYDGTPRNQSNLEFGEGAQGNVTNGSSGLSGKTLAALRISKSFGFKFGTASTPIEINATTAYIDAPRAEVHLKGSFDRIIVNRIPYLFTLQADAGSGKGIRDLVVIGDNGTISITDDVRVDRVFLYGSSVRVDVGEDVESYSGTGAETGPLELRVGRGNRLDGVENLNKIVVAGGRANFTTCEELIQFGSTSRTEFGGPISDGKILGGILSTPGTQATTPSKIVGDVQFFGGSIETNHDVITNPSGGGGGFPIEGAARLRLRVGQTVEIG